MSRRGHKTVNLPAALVEKIDCIVEAGNLTTATSRDDFVRQAVGLLFLALDKPSAIARPLQDLQADADQAASESPEALAWMPKPP
ncbi:MAG: hypothetical protein AABX89_03900 [Candidatus Thermoplasmatota archaeon]